MLSGKDVMQGFWSLSMLWPSDAPEGPEVMGFGNGLVAALAQGYRYATAR